jgi:pantetheine-phosphate adenylyltransferase
MNEKRIAVYPASFDPITNGHLDLVHRAARLFDEVVVAVATNVDKSGGTFTVDERVALLRDAVQGLPNVRVDVISTLLVDYLRRVNARIVIRGLRALADFEYEFQFSHMNRRLAPEIESVFFMTDERNHYVSSSLVKEVASLGGDVTGLVPPPVVAALAKKYGR